MTKREYTCEHCGAPFTTKHQNQRFCSRPCSDEALRRPPEDRFWALVDASGPCWLWTGSVWPNGYGCSNIVAPHSGRRSNAHRAAYELLVGPIPDDLDLDHLCRVRRCVNPDHLEPVTRSTNIKRSPITGRYRKWWESPAA